jgi:hypothetical protein
VGTRCNTQIECASVESKWPASTHTAIIAYIVRGQYILQQLPTDFFVTLSSKH